jgi:hypothetical protein
MKGKFMRHALTWLVAAGASASAVGLPWLAPGIASSPQTRYDLADAVTSLLSAYADYAQRLYGTTTPPRSIN